MSDAALLDLIRTTPWIAESLVRFDFDLGRVVDGPVEPVHLASGEPLEMIAGDASGGAFMLVGSGNPRPVVYVGSEGSGGLIAADLRTALALVVGLSSLQDAVMIRFGDDGGVRLREWLVRADNEIRAEWPGLDEVRQRLRQALDLPRADGLLEMLHRSAADENYRPISDAGDRYESMLR